MLDEDEKQELAQRLVDQAKARGVDLIGPGGLLSGLTKQVLDEAGARQTLEEEMAEHLGYDKHDPVGRNGQNSRNTRSKTVLTDVGPVKLEASSRPTRRPSPRRPPLPRPFGTATWS